MVTDMNKEDTEVNASFLIADLAGYSSLTEVHGDISAADSVSKFQEIVNESLIDEAKLVNQIGDEVLITSTNPESILRMAKELFNRTEREPEFPSIHIGIHIGNVVKREGKYYGNTINLTSRICSYSLAGQILCSEEFIYAVKDSYEFEFIKLGDVQFKNVSKPVSIYEIVTNSENTKTKIDPVCKMQVDTTNSQTLTTYKNKTYFFCSEDCYKKFIINPVIYIDK
jgi:class 3 adenylate cyclase